MSGFELEGWDDFASEIMELELDEIDLKNAVSKAVVPIYNEVKGNAPVETGVTEKSVKKSISLSNGKVLGKVKVGSWYSTFTNYGTSKDKSHIGWFDKSVDVTEDEALAILKKELFK